MQSPELPFFFLVFELLLLLVVAIPVLTSAGCRPIAARIALAASCVLVGLLLLSQRVDGAAVLPAIVAQALILTGAGLAYRCLSVLYAMPLSALWEIGVPATGFVLGAALWLADDSPGQLALAKPRVFAIAVPMATNAGYWLYRMAGSRMPAWSIGTRYLIAGASLALLGNIARPVADAMASATDPARSSVALPALGLGMVTSLLLVVGLMLEMQSRSRDLLEVSNARLSQDANTDLLTGVGNRRFMEASASAVIAASRARGLPTAILMLDVDHFKRVNDTFGHEAGDVALREVARMCSRGLRGNDVVARWGGEEFAILLSGADLDVCERVAQRIILSVRERPLAAIGGQRVTVSIGIAVFRPDEGLSSAQRRADTALYAAKAAGRDQYAIAT